MAAGATHEVLEHVGELELRVRAPDLAALLAEAGRALAEELRRGADPGGAPLAPADLTLELEAADAAALLVDFLNELIYRADAEGLLLDEFAFERCEARAVRCRARGVRATLAVPVKAATFHGLAVTTAADGTVEARVVLDI